MQPFDVLVIGLVMLLLLVPDYVLMLLILRLNRRIGDYVGRLEQRISVLEGITRKLPCMQDHYKSEEKKRKLMKNGK